VLSSPRRTHLILDDLLRRILLLVCLFRRHDGQASGSVESAEGEVRVCAPAAQRVLPTLERAAQRARLSEARLAVALGQLQSRRARTGEVRRSDERAVSEERRAPSKRSERACSAGEYERREAGAEVDVQSES